MPDYPDEAAAPTPDFAGDIRREVAATMQRVYRCFLTTTSGGNISARDDSGSIWVTPARVDKATLRSEDIVAVTAEGDILEAPHKPTSELPFHLAIYETRADIRAVVHAHPPALVAYSAAKRVPECSALYQVHQMCGDVKLAPYAAPGTEALGGRIAEQFATGANCVIMESHGVVVGGRCLLEAFQRLETLERACQILLAANALGEVRLLTPEQLSLWPGKSGLELEFQSDYHADSDGPHNGLRSELLRFMRRGYDRQLFISTVGTVSARCDDNSFVITPETCDRATVTANELERVSLSSRERQQIDGLAACHHAIYGRHDDIRCIMHAAPIHAAAHSVTGAEIRTNVIPECYMVLREIQRCSFEMPFMQPERIAEIVSMSAPVAMIENNGVLVCGSSLVDACDRLEVLESAAQATITCRAFGTVDMMSMDKIEALRKAMPETYGAIGREWEG